MPRAYVGFVDEVSLNFLIVDASGPALQTGTSQRDWRIERKSRPLDPPSWSFDAARHARQWRRSPPGALRGFPRRARHRLGPLGGRADAGRGAGDAGPEPNDLHHRLRPGTAVGGAQGEGRALPRPASVP